MKFNYITKGIMPALAIILSLSSCLKDDNIDQDFTDVDKKFVGIYDPSPSSSSPNSTSVGIVSNQESVVLNLQVRYIGNGVSPGVEVTVEVDPEVLAELNELRGTDYEELEAGDFSFPSTVTIPAGEKSVMLPVTLKPTVIVQTADDIRLYALPLRVTGGGGADISGNFAKHVVLVSIKNQYDGEYLYSGHIDRFINLVPDPATSGDFEDFEALIVTINPTQVWFDTQLWASGDGIAGIGTPQADGIMFTVNPVTNKVTVSCPANAAMVNSPGYDSRWDPDTETFYVKFQWGANANNLRIATDTLVRQGPRP